MGEQQVPTLIKEMLSPVFYGDQDTKNVHLIQTHISFLLIGDRYTYKIKKSLNLGFLDFTQLADRKHYCEEEIRLNKKLAPKLYLEAVTIYQNKEGKYSLTSEEGSFPVEYAVKMNTFDNTNLFSTLFDDGKLTEQTFLELAKHIAKHHLKAAQTNKEIASYGKYENIKSILDGNFSIVDNYVDNTISTALLQKIKTKSYRFLEDNKHYINERVTLGKIKENHGDLHLNNICLYKNHVQVFDCIEFNEQFKNIDCIYDVAFLYMDLLFRNHKTFAYTFLNEYLEQTGDYKAVQLLPLYASMRAVIRGKVISIETKDNNIGEAQRAKAKRNAQAYFSLAANFLNTSTGKVYVVMGLSGSGKSTLAKQLANHLGAIHIRSDAVRKHLTNTGLLERKNIYTEEVTSKTYDELNALGIGVAQAGFPVIIDATFLTQSKRVFLRNNLKGKGISTEFILCDATKETLLERIAKRTSDVSDATKDVRRKQLDFFERPEDEEHIKVNTGQADYFERLLSGLGLIEEY